MRLTRTTLAVAMLLTTMAAGCGSERQGSTDKRSPAPGAPAGDASPTPAPPPPPAPAPASGQSGGGRSPASEAPSTAVPQEKPAPRPRPSRDAAGSDEKTADQQQGGGVAAAPSDGFAALDAFVAHMKTASAALRAMPARVELGQRIDVRLRVSPRSSETELRQRLQAPGATVDTGTARIAPRMKAQLIVPDGASVAVVGSDEQAVRDDEDTEWRWTVTPGASGDLPIRARLTAPVTIDGKETAFDVRTFEASVTVFVTPTTRVVGFVERNWQWLWTSLLLPVWAWWRKRKSATSTGDAAHT